MEIVALDEPMQPAVRQPAYEGRAWALGGAMIHVEIRGEFPLGQIVATKNAVDTLDPSDVLACIQRHAKCDWGNLSSEDKNMNDLALEDEGRILSVYEDSKGTKFWIITEWDRSATTVLLPEDY